MGERGLCKPEVVGSIPSSSTTLTALFGVRLHLEARICPTHLLVPSSSTDELVAAIITIRGSLITEYLSELRASCMQDVCIYKSKGAERHPRFRLAAAADRD